MDQACIQRLFSVTEIELVYRNKVRPADRLRVNSADLAYDFFLNAWDMNKIELCEQFMILLLDGSNFVLGLANISTGGISACVVDPKLVFATALKAKASGIIMAHNHPSGSLKPSSADISLTDKFREGGKLLDISILDHLIVTPQSFYSFAHEGLIP
jgi:DNA repair protein RadC